MARGRGTKILVLEREEIEVRLARGLEGARRGVPLLRKSPRPVRAEMACRVSPMLVGGEGDVWLDSFGPQGLGLLGRLHPVDSTHTPLGRAPASRQRRDSVQGCGGAVIGSARGGGGSPVVASALVGKLNKKYRT